MNLFGSMGQGWLQLGELLLAFVLCSLVGLEREVRQKSAGFRTHTLVGVSAALFMLISKYGFNDVLEASRVVLDPSRIAAQIVSGIGFIGGGVIFMRRDVVRGLTTAASVWLTAALGMACGAGLPVLAVATTVFHFVIMLLFPRVARLLPQERRARTRLHLVYDDEQGTLREVLVICARLRFSVDDVTVVRDEAGDADRSRIGLEMQVRGKRRVTDLISGLSELPGVRRVGTLGDPMGSDPDSLD